MKQFITILLLATLVSCTAKKAEYDASGTFEAVETIVSAEASGKILKLTVEEGQVLQKNTVVGFIDPVAITLQKEQVLSSMQALEQKTSDAGPQLSLINDQLQVQQSRLNNLLHEQQRISNLVKADAATRKQADDIASQVEVARKELVVTRQQKQVLTNNVAIQNNSVLSEKLPLSKRVAQLQDQENKATITNPVNGTVLTRYAEVFEMTTAGKPIYKIADMSTMILRAYITGDQFSLIRLNQQVTILADSTGSGYKKLNGVIEWISDKAEFTPKTIQTKEERANLVYAIKIRVVNDGYLKIGMYGHVKFN